ncbi:hypothetical protein H1230_27040 [Paenibacillus sp. 19GGS1-52]|uniref:DUF2231 domain-containing protein n=1 Tax=Paenibacillus sp. 19GGS1-52 TaxID=2758563 RepID=UPI001EFB2636|nr:DUF2231 domain-containing protein [Paenibacillus sp. 19GGS1-52]ULO06611.1 hypothetical protein H1230_27040 [Paenibacillus sp. 19GGS1-52]
MSTPLHPLIVHFPIALLSLGAVLQLIALWKPNVWNTIANFCLMIGFVSAIVAYLTGDGGEHFAKQVFGTQEAAVHTHETFAMFTLIVFGIIVAIKLYQLFPVIPQLKKYAKFSFSKVFIPVLIVLSLTGGTLVVLTGHYGGKLVYQAASQGK